MRFWLIEERPPGYQVVPVHAMPLTASCTGVGLLFRQMLSLAELA